MRNVSASPAKFGGRKSALFLLLALTAAAIWPAFGNSTSVFADEAAAAPAAAPAADVAAAAAPADVTAAPVQSRSFLAYIARACGWFWGPAFLLVSFILVALIMMNMLQVRRDVLLPSQFVEEFEQKLNAKDFQGAYEFARADESFVGRVLAAGMGRLSRGYPEAVEGMQEAGEDETMALEHRLSYVAMIGSIAPMMGLMGTVQGMISSFDKIALSVVAPKPSELADGISTALVTTLIGLLLAIPAMVFHGVLKNRIQRLVLEIGMVSEGLMGRFATVGKPK
ncbi:MAG: MotA/TolQ/ExbB proton channel family protein [Planctomycetota bacterium]|nr:MAG: MotA/TolQ/ExbB proton channel family protein [Planctomycetota bacterium]